MQYRSSPYRWIIILCVFPILAVTQMFWLTFSAISPEAVKFYHTSSMSIDFLSMSYMIVFIIMMIPASLLADKKGLRVSFVFGAVVTAVFGVLRWLCSDSFTLVVLAQMGMAIAQPFLVNPITKLAAMWFPVDERATASGIASIAGYIGIIVAMIATPALYGAYHMRGMLEIYGFIAVAAALLVIILLRESPKVPAGPRGVDEDFSLRKVPELRKNRSYMWLLLVVFIALGVFNALLTCISAILTPRGLTIDQAGLVGGIIIIAGLIGGIVIPLLSDKLKKRRFFLTFSILFALVGMVGLSYLSGYTVLLVFAAITGFFLMGVGPMVFQFGTELAYPVPEGTAYGLLMGSGQISGILFIILLNVLTSKDGFMTLPLTILMVFMAAAFIFTFRVSESSMIQNVQKEEN